MDADSFGGGIIFKKCHAFHDIKKINFLQERQLCKQRCSVDEVKISHATMKSVRRGSEASHRV